MIATASPSEFLTIVALSFAAGCLFIGILSWLATATPKAPKGERLRR